MAGIYIEIIHYLCTRFKNNYTLRVNIRISLLYVSSRPTKLVHVFINE
jgi:hypothetical protein